MITSINEFRKYLNEGIQESEQTFPSLNFSKATGIDFVTTDWKLPTEPNKLAQQIHTAWDNKDISEFKKSYQQIIDLNPELAKIKYKTSNDMFDIIYGAISKFNFDDINFFTQFEHSRELIHYNIESKPIREQLAKKFNVPHLAWVLSPITTKKLLDIKYP